MPIDSYSLCPGGTGKKIKFCCPDLLDDLKELSRMIEGGQNAAALQHIESLEKSDKPRACLLAMKIQLLQSMDRNDEAKAATGLFVETFPDNPIALAESAIEESLEGDAQIAMQRLQQSLASSSERLYPQVYQAMGSVADRMIRSGFVGSARALWYLQTTVNQEDREPSALLARISRSEAVPLLLKSEQSVGGRPKDETLTDRFLDAIEPLNKAGWAESAEKLEALVEQAPDEPVLWRSLAAVRTWLADRDGAVEALEKFASLDVPLEDAVEAEAMALLMRQDPLGDETDGVELTYTINEADELAGFLSTWKHAVPLPYDPNMFVEQDEVPPKAVFWLLDRPLIDSAEGLTLETVSSSLGQGILFGKQTDREAKLIITGAISNDQATIEKLLSDLAGDRIVGSPEVKPVGTQSATRTALSHPWRLPSGVTPKLIRELAAQHLAHSLYETWPDIKMGIFDGRSPREVAGEKGQEIRLLAAILVVENWVQQMHETVDFNRLRSELGLPVLELIDPAETSQEGIPLVRLDRVIVEKLDNEHLINGFQRALVYGIHSAVTRFGLELIKRPNIDTREKQLALASLAHGEPDPDQALDYIEQGRQMAESEGGSSAPWDLNELELRMSMGDAAEASRLFDHLKQEHIQEPGVADGLRAFLYRAGMLDAQGRPIMPGQAGAEEPIVEPEQESAGKLWTPDGDRPSGEKSKLWTPDD